MIISFGYKHGGPPPGARLLFDIRRTCPNPWSDRKDLRHLSGLHAEVQQWFKSRPAAERVILRIIREIEDYAGPTNQYGWPNVAIGCTGGRHRSVYVASEVGRRLSFEVQHRDLSHANEDEQ